MRRGTWLSPSSRACLQQLLKAGMCSSRELDAVQRSIAGGATRSDTAVQKTPYNLQALGYIRRVTCSSGVLWTLTDKGRATAVASSEARVPPSAPVDIPAIQPGALLTRAVRYGAGVVQLPIAVRWVFDLGAHA